MNEFVLDGFEEELEKIASWGGIGRAIKGAYKGLKAGKFRGKGSVGQYLKGGLNIAKKDIAAMPGKIRAIPEKIKQARFQTRANKIQAAAKTTTHANPKTTYTLAPKNSLITKRRLPKRQLPKQNTTSFARTSLAKGSRFIRANPIKSGVGAGALGLGAGVMATRQGQPQYQTYQNYQGY